jgi:carbonic anhydrase
LLQVIRENALYQITRCKRSTIILEAVTKGNLILVPAVYDITTGEVLVIEDEE